MYVGYFNFLNYLNEEYENVCLCVSGKLFNYLKKDEDSSEAKNRIIFHKIV